MYRQCAAQHPREDSKQAYSYPFQSISKLRCFVKYRQPNQYSMHAKFTVTIITNFHLLIIAD